MKKSGILSPMIRKDGYKSIRIMIGILLFSIFAVFGLSLLTGNKEQTNIGSSLASVAQPADINNDNKVDVFDLSILLSKWNTNDTLSDLNKDATVNVFDLSILLSKWGAVATTKPLLIKHGWDVPSPLYIKNNVSKVDAVPVDGVVITMPNYSSKVRSQTPISYEQFKQELAPLAGLQLQNVVHNFIITYSVPAGDYFGDWTIPISNYSNLARAAHEVGLEGIVYDSEEYFGNSSNYPEHCPGHTLLECQEQVRLRGKQIMDAIRAQWPTARVLSLYGPWVSESKTYNALSPYIPYNDVAWANELVGPFIIGMIESTLGSTAKVIDGGELYTPRTNEQFAAVRAWQTDGMANNSTLIPNNLKSSYAQLVSNSHGIFDQPWQGAPMDINIWQTTIRNAMANADDYVWLYTEKYDWWGTGWPTTPVPADWISATRSAAAN